MSYFEHSSRFERTLRLILIAFSIGCILYISRQKPVLTGDAREYYLTAESFANHLSPDLRSEDIEAARTSFERDFQEALSDQPFGYFPSNTGELYSYHFWLYSFTTLPAQMLLRWTGADRLSAFAWTNVLFYLAALWSIAGFFRGSRAQKLTFLGLSAFNPAFFYLSWTHPEAWSFALVTISLVCFSRRNWTAATVFAALAATQNPPLIFLAGFFILIHLWEMRRNFRLRKAIGVCLAGAPAVTPMLFYYLHFGTPNLILRTGMADPRLASLTRLADLYLDLNMGMLPYIPVALCTVFVLLIITLQRRKISPALGLAPVLLAMSLACLQTANWNHGAAGLNRYAVWHLPLIFYLFSDWLPMRRPTGRGLAAAAVLTQAVLLLAMGPVSYMNFSPLARWVVEQDPALYNPDPEVFAERSLGRELYCKTCLKGYQPYLFIDSQGNVRKILADESHLEHLAQEKPEFTIQGKIVLPARSGAGMLYVNLPPGVMKLSPDAGTQISAFRNAPTVLRR
ncbi:hypothetical protein LARV_00591 [Longilinea arvoryzae]|uniref:Glycosyltransferase RgtA/B/C/D-like domain-containing protein n=1 Tax=Longilinea arvoryzae TaxID=360412 RepID=A0A0S7BEC7_9CHLR|nr:hypothetical protein [Longilinea arvoryzae]GAP12851.1 hypothetical protein LARV_00591 [Longilinea arvoryzae]